jgi:hypothetical protein
MPKVVYPNVIRVEPKVYNVLRSFLDSSLKDEYPWNTGIILPGTHTVLFTKTGKWTLNINHSSAVLFSKDKQVLMVEKGRVTLTIKQNTYQDVEDPNITYVLPDPPVPYYTPLSLRQILDKLEVYRRVYISTVEPDTIICARDCRTAFSPIPVCDC